jgi:plastocyanin
MQSQASTSRVTVVLGLLALMTAAGIVVGYGIGTTIPRPAAQGTTVTTTVGTVSSNSTAPFDLTLVITTDSIYNSTVNDQPAYFILGPDGIESSANMSLPANRLIRLTNICYDDGPANLTSQQYAQVSGTRNGVVTEVSNDNVNSSQGAAGIQVSGGVTVSSLPTDDVAHTFTIPQLGLNIPIMPSSAVVAYFTLTKAGTFKWFCETLCGSGPIGAQGAMSTPGWMTGNVVVG